MAILSHFGHKNSRLSPHLTVEAPGHINDFLVCCLAFHCSRKDTTDFANLGFVPTKRHLQGIADFSQCSPLPCRVHGQLQQILLALGPSRNRLQRSVHRIIVTLFAQFGQSRNLSSTHRFLINFEHLQFFFLASRKQVDTNDAVLASVNPCLLLRGCCFDAQLGDALFNGTSHPPFLLNLFHQLQSLFHHLRRQVLHHSGTVPRINGLRKSSLSL